MKKRAANERVKLWRLPELGNVELLHAHYITQNFPRHTHDGLAVGVIERGALGFFYRGIPPHAYLMQTRVRQAKALLSKGCRIVDVACSTGFVDQSHLTRHFRRTFGYTPGQYSNSVQDTRRHAY